MYEGWTGGETGGGGLPWQAIEALKDAWERLVGYRMPIEDRFLRLMVTGGVSTLFEFGQFMQNVIFRHPEMKQYEGVLAQMPGAVYGMDDDTYHATAMGFQDEYTRLTGQAIDPLMLKESMGKGAGYSVTQFGHEVTLGKQMRETYGWLKYGMDFQQFKDYQHQQQHAYGHELDDKSALAVLEDQHNVQSTGGGSGRQEAVGQPTPQKGTLGEAQAAIR